MDIADREALHKEFQKVADKSEHYCKNLSSNICESFANNRAKYTDKRLNQRVQFQLNCIMADQCVRKKENFNWKMLLLESLEINNAENMIKHFESEMQLKLKHMKRY